MKKTMATGFMAAAIVVILMLEIAGAARTKDTTEVLCHMNEDDLNLCKPAVQKTNPVTTPTPECCKALSGANLTCLCEYKNSFLLPALGIDPTLALALPAKCNLPNPSNCN
ncbi:putative lipid-transfer protein DIR1 [Impatiens glandulifera]|uniref:putative lipid-transfer protein DIR1 n=1 Tax=Impatiens glandulifera TaxID=253017 RepID=UPI001FB0DA45|nr:putative lipid-transfer protein DIR1 [Impatiens glandulifera]